MSQRHQNVSFARAKRLGLKLNGYVIKEIDVATDTACGFACNNEVNCLSYNSEIAPDQTGRFRCQLSDSDRFAGFDNFTCTVDTFFKYTGIQVTNIALLNLRSGPILAVLIHSLLRGRAKIGPDAKSVTLVLGAARFDCGADWLLEQYQRIRLAVGITES